MSPIFFIATLFAVIFIGISPKTVPYIHSYSLSGEKHMVVLTAPLRMILQEFSVNSISESVTAPLSGSVSL